MEVDNANVEVVLPPRVADDQKLDLYAFPLRLSSAEMNYDIGYCELLMDKLTLEDSTTQPYLLWTDHKPRAPTGLKAISMAVDDALTSSEDSSLMGDFILPTLIFLCVPISESPIYTPFSLCS